jgi:F0F1-type ATP synthase assembly protein I
MAQKPPNRYIRYTNLALQMGVTIGLAVWGGQKLDERFGNSTPYFTIVFSLTGIFASLYLVLRDLLRGQK